MLGISSSPHSANIELEKKLKLLDSWSDHLNASQIQALEISSSWTKAESSRKKYLKIMPTFKELSTVHYRCLDVEAMEQQYDSIKTRVWQKHVVKAYEMYELAEHLKMQETAAKDQSDTMSEDSYRGASEIFEDVHDRSKPFRPQIMFQDTKMKKKDASISARKLGLTKQEEFTGKKAEALKKLLKTLRFKTWTPNLYLQIRYFSIRHQLQDSEKKELARKRWFFLLKMLSLMRRIGIALAERCYERVSACVTYCDMVADAIRPICWGPNGTLPFDKDDYTTKANITISTDALKTVRDKKPANRKPEEIAQCVLSLQYVHAFAKLPTDIQHRLVAQAFNLRVKEKKVIIKQEHIPQNFYFVLSGQAFSKRFLPNGKTETTAVLRRGDVFGTAAIFNKCRRLVSVVSQTPMNLLVVPRICLVENFINLGTDPHDDNIQFLQKMWFMQTWPIEFLSKCPSQCCRKQFRRTEIIEHDAALSKWIYIVSNPKGICRVFQRIPLSTIPEINALRKVHRRLTLESVPLLLGSHRNVIEVPDPESRPSISTIRAPSPISQSMQLHEKTGKEHLQENSADSTTPVITLCPDTAKSRPHGSSSSLLPTPGPPSSQLEQTCSPVASPPPSILKSRGNEGSKGSSDAPQQDKGFRVVTPIASFTAGKELTSQIAEDTVSDVKSVGLTVPLVSRFKSSPSGYEAESRRQAFYQKFSAPKRSLAVKPYNFLDDRTLKTSVKSISRKHTSFSHGRKSVVGLRATVCEEEKETMTYKAHSLLSLLYDDPNLHVYSMTVSAKDDKRGEAEKKKVVFKNQIKDMKAFDLCMPGRLPSSNLATSVVCHIPVLRKTNKPTTTTKYDSYDYKLVTTLRYLDVFGLEDIVLDPRDPPPDRNLILISDGVECVMLSKSFYLRLASVTLRKKVLARIRHHLETYRQVTHYDCSMISKGGIQQPKDSVLDPIQPAYCIHC